MVKGKYFIGAFGGAGTRILSQVSEKLGYYVGGNRNNQFYDYGNDYFVAAFNKYWFTKSPLLENYLKQNLRSKDQFVIKHGHLMYIQPELQEWFPGSKLIYMMRNPIDNALKSEYNPQHRYFGKSPSFENRVSHYIEYSEKMINQADYFIRLEDLCFKPKETLESLFEFLEVEPQDLSPFIEMIKPSSTIGSGKHLYKDYDLSKLGY